MLALIIIVIAPKQHDIFAMNESMSSPRKNIENKKTRRIRKKLECIIP